MASVEEAQEILGALGMPRAQRNRMSGMTLIALCRLAPDASWSTAQRLPCTITKGVMDYLKQHFDTEYAPNTREPSVAKSCINSFRHGSPTTTRSSRICQPTARAPTTPSRKRPCKRFGSTVPRLGILPWTSSVASRVFSCGATRASGLATRFRSRYPKEMSFDFLPVGTMKFRRLLSKYLGHVSRLVHSYSILAIRRRRT